MPTYEYKCAACGIRFEKFQSMSAAPIKKCPECGKARVQRLIGTGAGLIFKGSGFYITDYRDSGYKEKAKAESGGGSDAKTETKGETKAESKPAAETKPSEPKPKAESKPPEKPSKKK
jgi:putative FmdB family regulatory protein